MILLSHSYSLPTARLLREYIQEKMGIRLILTTRTEKILQPILIRYGNSSPVSVKDTEYNSPNFIRLVSLKTRFNSKLMKEGIPAITLQRGIPEYYPVILRTRLTLSGGRGIEVIKNEDEFEAREGNYFWSYFVNMRFELRVHLLNVDNKFKIVKVFKKVYEGEKEDKYPIRVAMNGYHYSLRKPPKYPKLSEFIDEINNAGTLHSGKFIALDVGWNPQKKSYVVIEGNTAPGLNTQSVQIYGKYFIKELFNHETKNICSTV